MPSFAAILGGVHGFSWLYVEYLRIPLSFLFGKFVLEEGVPRNWVFEPGFNVWRFLLNTFVIIVFATIYLAVTKSLFRILKLGAFKITNTTAALSIVAINLFFSFRSRSMAFPFPDQIDYPLRNFQYGIPIADSTPDPDFGAITNYPVAVLGNTLFALGFSTISALCVAVWKQRQSRRITTRGAQALTATK